VFDIYSDINHREGHHSCECRNPGKYWIPPYQVRGRLSQARNDRPHKTYVVMYDKLYLNLWKSKILRLPITALGFDSILLGILKTMMVSMGLVFLEIFLYIIFQRILLILAKRISNS